MTPHALTTLVIGADAGLREAAIAEALDPALVTAVIMEGMPAGIAPLADLAENNPRLFIFRITPGCICCSGNLVMRVTLNRVLHHPPQRLYISLADATHLERIRQFLEQEPYGTLLSLTKEMVVDSRRS